MIDLGKGQRGRETVREREREKKNKNITGVRWKHISKVLNDELQVIISPKMLEVGWLGFAPADNWAPASDPEWEWTDHQIEQPQ